jgi:hypothetical protein
MVVVTAQYTALRAAQTAGVAFHCDSFILQAATPHVVLAAHGAWRVEGFECVCRYKVCCPELCVHAVTCGVHHPCLASVVAPKHCKVMGYSLHIEHHSTVLQHSSVCEKATLLS